MRNKSFRRLYELGRDAYNEGKDLQDCPYSDNLPMQ